MTQASADINYLHNKALKSNAKVLRANMTKAEACLWKYVLKGRKLKGYQFRRQRLVLNYIADFMCKELSLIIEVDGMTYSYENVSKTDLIRQNELEDAGFTVIQFADEEVLANIERVRIHLEDLVERIKKIHPQPPPAGDKVEFGS